MSTFLCPKCGSSYFWSSGPADVGLHAPVATWTGHCKGALIRRSNYTGCTFTWSRADDAKYGLVNHGGGATEIAVRE